MERGNHVTRPASMAKPDPNCSRLHQPDPASTRSSPITSLTLHPPPSTLLSTLLLLVVLGAFLPALRNGFVDYDDNLYITENSHIQSGLTWESIRWAFRSTDAANWHPLTWLSHILDCQLFGLRPWGHHLTNVLFHAANTMLLFVILRKMTGAVWRSLFVAALFGLHPLHVESVAWVAERKDVLSTFFFLATLWAYTRYVECRIRSAEWGVQRSQAEHPTSNITHHVSRITFHVSFFYLLALLFFAFGLMSKPMLVTLPFVLLLLDFWPLNRLSFPFLQHSNTPAPQLSIPPLQVLLEKLPFLLLAVIASAVTFLVQKSEGAMERMAGLSFIIRAENALVSYCRYLAKLFWPVKLSVFYPYPDQWPGAAVLLAGLLLLGVTAVVIVRRRQAPYLVVGWLWFIGMLVPVIGLVQVGEAAMADRYSYIPLVGMLILLAWGAHDLLRSWRYSTAVLSAAAGAAILVCTVLTRQQVAYWKNSETLFRHALGVTENNFLALHNLAGVLSKDGHLPEAIGLFETAIRLRPMDPAPHNGLAYALLQQGSVDEAISQFQQALSYAPNYVRAHDNLGIALSRKGRLDDAIVQFREALKLKPGDAKAHNNLGMALQAQGRLDEAITQLEQAVALNPYNAGTHNNLGMALGRKGRLDEAIGHLRQALKLNPKDAQARSNLGLALSKQGHLDEAIVQFEQALQLKPNSAETHASLGAALAGVGRRAEAISQFTQALKLRPNYPEAERQLRALGN
jgi:Flp pilus assembly protein TadD